jgi:hypothetical protein
MAYADIFATEARGMFSPPNGNHPQILPDYWKETPESEARTDLPELSIEELNALGWKGPIEDVPFDFYTQDKDWNTETREWEIAEIDQFNKEKKVNYQKFWDELIDTSAYIKIKATASQSLLANTLATEFIALLGDAKNGNANIAKIQQELLEILENIPFTEEELLEIQTAFTNSGMYSIYSLEPSA